MIQPFDELLKPIQIKELIFLSPIEFECEKNENKTKKRPGLAHFLKNNSLFWSEIFKIQIIHSKQEDPTQQQYPSETLFKAISTFLIINFRLEILTGG